MNKFSATAEISISVVVSVLGSVAVTWVLWAYFGIAASGWAVYVTVIAIIGMYAMPAFLLLGKLRRNRGLITIAATSGLLITLVISSVSCEIVHCQYDRAGCINL